MGNEAKSMFGCTPSNDAYGRTEASLIFKNGDPVADMLYTTNFAFVGLCEAAMATQDPVYLKAVNQMRDFLIRIQVSSEKFKNVDGAWFRAFHYNTYTRKRIIGYIHNHTLNHILSIATCRRCQHHEQQEQIRSCHLEATFFS